MINKFKDFLKKKLGTKASSDSSDQDELLDDDDVFTGEHTNPTMTLNENVSEEDSTNASLDRFDETSTSAGDNSINSFPEETPENDEGTGQYVTNNTNANETSSLKDRIKERLTSSLTVMREKFSGTKAKITAKKDKSSKAFAFPKISFSKFGSKADGPPLLSPSLTNSVEKFLSRSNRESIHQAALILLICAITFTLGKVTALVMKGAPALDSAKDFTVSISAENSFNPATLTQVKSINLFKTNNPGPGKKTNVADKKCEEAEQQSNLPIKLVNTVVLQDVIKSIASVQIRGDRDLQEVRVGDQISNLAQIFKITRLSILVKNLESGMCESIASDLMTKERKSPISVLSPAQSREFKANKKLSGIDNVGNKFVISKALLDDKLKDIGKILTQARAVQIQNPDGSLAFKMTELDPTGIFPYLGVQDGDIITSINGKPIYDMNEVMLLFGRIKGLESLSLGIKREGTETTQDYSIKK